MITSTVSNQNCSHSIEFRRCYSPTRDFGTSLPMPRCCTVDQETFDTCQRLRNNVRRYPNGWGETHPLTGLMYCADCGAKMYVHRTSNGKRIAQYTCSAYSKVPVGTRCPTQHRVNADAVIELIKTMLKAISE